MLVKLNGAAQLEQIMWMQQIELKPSNQNPRRWFRFYFEQETSFACSASLCRHRRRHRRHRRRQIIFCIDVSTKSHANSTTIGEIESQKWDTAMMTMMMTKKKQKKQLKGKKLKYYGIPMRICAMMK